MKLNAPCCVAVPRCCACSRHDRKLVRKAAGSPRLQSTCLAIAASRLGLSGLDTDGGEGSCEPDGVVQASRGAASIHGPQRSRCWTHWLQRIGGTRAGAARTRDAPRPSPQRRRWRAVPLAVRLEGAFTAPSRSGREIANPWVSSTLRKPPSEGRLRPTPTRDIVPARTACAVGTRMSGIAVPRDGDYVFVGMDRIPLRAVA